MIIMPNNSNQDSAPIKQLTHNTQNKYLNIFLRTRPITTIQSISTKNINQL